MDRKTLWVGVSIAFLIAATAWTYMNTRQPALNGVVFKPASAAGDIQLTDQNGAPFRLYDQHGKIVLVFFGYTNCPDECPLTMAKLSAALDQLGDGDRRVQVVLITTDPANDTPPQLKAYVERFRPDFLGLTGTPEQLQEVWGEYGVVVMDGGETHSTRTYVIDPIGNLVMTLPYEMSVDEIVSDLRLLLRAY